VTTAIDSDERLDDLDRAILGFASCHPLVLFSQIQKLLDLEEAEWPRVLLVSIGTA
jgi:hypothetical protein